MNRCKRFLGSALVMAAAAGLIFTSCETTGGQSGIQTGGQTAGGSILGTEGFPEGSPEEIAFTRLEQGGKDGGTAWSVATNADGSMWVRSRPYALVKGGPDFMGSAALFEPGRDKASAMFFDDNAVNTIYGASTAISADSSLIVIGAPEAKQGGVGYVFGYLRHPDGTYPLWFRFPAMGDGWRWGMDVDMSGQSGTTVVIGAPGEGGYGRVRYYLEPEPGWPEANDNNMRSGILGTGEPRQGDEFGRSVAISRDDSTIIIGSPGRNDNMGIAYIFKKPEAGWLATTTLYPLSLAAEKNERFGQSVDISNDGSVMAVGAPGAANGEGGVYIITDFVPDKGFKETFLSFEGDSGLGIAVAVSGDGRTAAVGGYGTEYSGSVKVYRSQSGKWDDIELIANWAGDPSKEDQKGAMLGFSLDLTDDGEKILVGIPFWNNGQGSDIWFNLEQ